MSPSPPVDVTPAGTILLGDRVCCDGDHRDYPVRVQTHVHMDHMADFNRSKGEQDICLTEPTRHLLALEQVDLPCRNNVRVLAPGHSHLVGDTAVTLASSGHMLGSVQVRVELPDGRAVGYSGDFAWPLDEVIRVNQLVVDSTYGSPQNKREYDQAAAEARFLELIDRLLKRGPVNVLAHRGKLQRAMQC